MGSTVATPGHIAAVVRVAHHDDRCGVHGKPWEKTGCLVRVRSKTQMFWIVELLHYWIVFCYHGPSPWSRLHDVSNDTYSYIRYHIYICKYTSKYDTSNFCYLLQSCSLWYKKYEKSETSKTGYATTVHDSCTKMPKYEKLDTEHPAPSVIRFSLGRRLVNLLPVAQRTNAFTNGVVDRPWVVGREFESHVHHENAF